MKRWSTSEIAEELMMSVRRITEIVNSYDIKGTKQGVFRFYSEEEIMKILRIRTLMSKNIPRREIINIIGKKGTYMKVDRIGHPVLTFADMESFVNQLTELEEQALIEALTHKVAHKKVLEQLKSQLKEVEDGVDKGTSDVRKRNSLLQKIEDMKQLIEDAL